MSNDFYTDAELEELFGKREVVKGIVLFDPIELGWVCPNDKHHMTTWSEFEGHIWCYACEMDWFTLLCNRIVNPFTTEKVVRRESNKLKEEVSKWTIERYKNFKNEKGG